MRTIFRLLLWCTILSFNAYSQYQIIDNTLYRAVHKEGISAEMKLEIVGPVSDSDIKSLINIAVKNHFKKISERLKDIKGIVSRSDSLYVVTDDYELGFQIETIKQKNDVMDALTTLYKSSYSKIREVRGVR